MTQFAFNLDLQPHHTSILRSPCIPPSQNTIIPFDFPVSPHPSLKKEEEREREEGKKAIVSCR